MEAVRDKWTDARLDNLNKRVDDGFRRMDERFAHVDQRFNGIDARFDSVQRTMQQGLIAIFVAMLGLIATQL